MCHNTKRIIPLIIIFIMLLTYNVCSAKICSAKTKTMYTKKPCVVKTKKTKRVVPQHHKVKVKMVKVEKATVNKNSQNETFFETNNNFPNITILTPHDYFTWVLPKKVKVGVGKIKGEIKVKDLTSKKPKSVTKKIPYNTFKSYMSYRAITSKSSPQYKLQQKAYTDNETGVRMVEGRYCIAVGPKVSTRVGTKLDLLFKNGKIVPAIVADQKAGTIDGYRHGDGSAVEFVVDNNALPRCAKRAGDMSALNEFKGRITRVKVYKKRKERKRC